ncbi:uncharacterized protein METZ01_LOCUS278163 [marine metagenome]|uniref:Uncharacterized protein n=1 Tax=marine metagenome TaxID=408172 RepID=A0A382KM41_9ZZZZ
MTMRTIALINQKGGESRKRWDHSGTE